MEKRVKLKFQNINMFFQENTIIPYLYRNILNGISFKFIFYKNFSFFKIFVKYHYKTKYFNKFYLLQINIFNYEICRLGTMV